MVEIKSQLEIESMRAVGALAAAQLEMIEPPVTQRYKRGPSKYGALQVVAGAIGQTSIIRTFHTVATTISSVRNIL